MIKKSGSTYKVMDGEGKKTLGTHPTYGKALDQLRAIEASKSGYKDGGKKVSVKGGRGNIPVKDLVEEMSGEELKKIKEKILKELKKK